MAKNIKFNKKQVKIILEFVYTIYKIEKVIFKYTVFNL